VPIRAVALGIPAAFAIALFGGTFPYLAELLIDRDQLRLVPAYATLGLTVSAIGSWLVRETLLYDVETLTGSVKETA